VIWRSPGRNRVGPTDAKGEFNFSTPPNEEIALEVREMALNRIIFRGESFRLREGQIVQKDITIGADLPELEKLRPICTLTGRVVTTGGTPVPEATVYLGNSYVTLDSLCRLCSGRHTCPIPPTWEGGSLYPAYIKSDKDGRFAFNMLLPGRTDVWAEHPSFGSGWVHNLNTDRKDIKIALQPKSETVTFSGTVLDPDAQPVVGVPIHIYGEQKGKKFLITQTQSNGEGGFIMEIKPSQKHFRNLTLLCIPRKGPLVWKTVPHCSSSNLQLRLKRKATISGRVVNRNGNGIAEAVVRLYRVGHPDYGTLLSTDEIVHSLQPVHTDEEGYFRLGKVPIGSSVSLYADHPKHGSEYAWSIWVSDAETHMEDIKLTDGIQAKQFPGRIINFPDYPDPNESLGSIYIYEGRYNSTDKHLTEARGTVKIPPGKNVLLRVSDDVDSLSALANLKPDDIQAISLQGCDKLPPEEFNRLAKLTGLNWIDLWNLKNKDLSFLEHLNPEHLILNNSPSHKQLYPLRELTLRRLGTDHANLTDEDLKDIVGAKGGPKVLLARWNNIKGPGYRYLNSSERLEMLCISGNPTDDKGIYHLDVPHLNNLVANDMFLTDDGIEHIVKNHPSLTELEIGNEKTKRIKITNKSFELLSRLELETLKVSGASLINGGALKHLHSPLEALHVSDTPFTDADTALMPDSVYWTQWNGTKLTDKGMPGFKKYKLKFLDVRGTDVTIDGINSAKESFLPNSNIWIPDHSKMNYPAPELTFEKVLQKSDGNTTSLKELRGKIVVLESWATWCGFCKHSVPHNNDLSRQLADEPVQIIYVTDEKESEVREFLKKNEIRGWIGLDPEKSVFKAYGIRGRPDTVVIGQMGQLITRIRWKNLDAWRIKAAISGNYKPLQSQQSDALMLEGSEISRDFTTPK
jgi:thiol-disulfide isomerase/thioredoxin